MVSLDSFNSRSLCHWASRTFSVLFRYPFHASHVTGDTVPTIYHSSPFKVWQRYPNFFFESPSTQSFSFEISRVKILDSRVHEWSTPAITISSTFWNCIFFRREGMSSRQMSIDGSERWRNSRFDFYLRELAFMFFLVDPYSQNGRKAREESERMVCRVQGQSWWGRQIEIRVQTSSGKMKVKTALTSPSFILVSCVVSDCIILSCKILLTLCLFSLSVETQLLQILVWNERVERERLHILSSCSNETDQACPSYESQRNQSSLEGKEERTFRVQEGVA